MLTTLAKAKTLLQIPQLDIEDDLFIEPMLAAASSAIEDYCRRSFGYQAYTNGKFNGVRGSFLLLPNYPVHTVELLQIGGGPEPTDSFEIDTDNGTLYRKCGWPRGERSITVTYTAGYVLPGEDPIEGIPPLPESLELACILLAQTLAREPGITAERVGDISVSYAANDGAGLPSAVKALINPHRRWL